MNHLQRCSWIIRMSFITSNVNQLLSLANWSLDAVFNWSLSNIDSFYFSSVDKVARTKNSLISLLWWRPLVRLYVNSCHFVSAFVLYCSSWLFDGIFSPSEENLNEDKQNSGQFPNDVMTSTNIHQRLIKTFNLAEPVLHSLHPHIR